MSKTYVGLLGYSMNIEGALLRIHDNTYVGLYEGTGDRNDFVPVPCVIQIIGCDPA